MSRMRDALRRGESFRDSKLMVIACEGVKTEREYFEGIKVSLRQTRLRVQVVERENVGASSPASVVQTLLDYKREEGEPDDLYWAVLDRDEQSWSGEQIHQAIKLCQGESLNWAISNPFFEVWIAMHFVADAERMDQIGVDQDDIKRYVGDRKNQFSGDVDAYYNDLAARLTQAIAISGECGCRTDDLVPARLCSQVYRIAQQLVDLS